MSNCKKCDNVITGGALKFQDDKYHPECFVCHHCNGQLAGKSICQYQGNYYDQECYAEHCAKKCGKCNKACSEPGVSYTSYNGKTFHPECFACDKCGSIFGDDAEFYEDGDEKICTTCGDEEE